MTDDRTVVKPLAVVAIGGNALARRDEPADVATQRRNLKRVAPSLVALARTHRLVITHGNGPQVGRLAAQTPVMDTSLDVLDAQTAGEIGYLLCESLDAFGAARTATLITRVEVDLDDAAFASLTKPIGPLLSSVDANALVAARGWSFVARGAQMRRVVASPEPQRIVEIDIIRSLVEQDVIVVCAGGGGVPVTSGVGVRRGLDAVIDKDLSSSLLAIGLAADTLVILTDVDAVRVGFGTPDEQRVLRATPAELRRYAFEAGSMAPKVLAACRFVEATGRVAHIADLVDLEAVMRNAAGTRVATDATWLAEPILENDL
jgi:carbamate kinase